MDWVQIESWLSTLYKKEGKEVPIPNFERTNKNYKLLNNLLNLNINSTKLVETIINNLNHAADNNNNNNNNNNSSSSLGNISVSGQRVLNSLASIAQSLELSTTRTSDYYTAISQLSMDQMDLSIQQDHLNEIEYKIDTCQREADEELTKMKDILTKLQQEQPLISNQKENVLQVKEKTSEYLLLEEKYHQLGIERRGVRLNDLHQLDIKTNQLEIEQKEKRDILSSYQVLPSEMILASIKIQETEDQLRELENQREQLLSDIADRML